MLTVTQTAELALRQAPEPALRLDVLLERVRTEPGRSGLREDTLRAALEAEPHRFRVLDPWRGPWRRLEPGRLPALSRQPWVVMVSDPGTGDAPTNRTAHRLRESVRWLALHVDDESGRSVTRWHAVAVAACAVEATLRDKAA